MSVLTCKWVAFLKGGLENKAPGPEILRFRDHIWTPKKYQPNKLEASKIDFGLQGQNKESQLSPPTS